MGYELYYFVGSAGVAPVRQYLQGLPISQRAKVYAFMDYIAEYGPQARRPAADYLGDRLGLYEIRPKPHRVLYFFCQRRKIVLLHAFYKRSKEIPEADILQALQHKARCLDGNFIQKMEKEGDEIT